MAELMDTDPDTEAWTDEGGRTWTYGEIEDWHEEHPGDGEVEPLPSLDEQEAPCATEDELPEECDWNDQWREW